jgi:serine/threonine protein phosphatase PrpC
VAVRHLLDAIGDDPPESFAEDEWLDLFGAANDAIVAATGRDSEHPSSETVLIAALAAPGRLSFAAIGDGALVLARPGTTRGRQLNREAMRFAGRPMNRRALRHNVQCATVDLDPDEWIVAVTDGLSEFIVPLRPADVVPRVLAGLEEPSAEAAAVALVETACAAGAGDNVAAAVAGP